MLAIALLGLACDGVGVADPRYATPERTVATLLASVRVPPGEDDALEILDPDGFRGAFDGPVPASDGGVRRLVARLRSAGSDLRVVLFGDRATVTLPGGDRYLLRLRSGGYRFHVTQAEMGHSMHP